MIDQPSIQNTEYECINIINPDKIYIKNSPIFGQELEPKLQMLEDYDLAP